VEAVGIQSYARLGMAKHSHTVTGQFSQTVTLRITGIHHLWPEWVSFLVIAVILVVLLLGAMWMASGGAPRLRSPRRS
jgi:hypothetical protein